MTHQTPGSSTPALTPGFGYLGTPGASFAGGSAAGSAFYGGARVGTPLSPATHSPGPRTPAYAYGGALGSMMSGAASASATPGYRHDAAAMFTGGGAAAAMGSALTGEDAHWVTVRRDVWCSMCAM